MRWGISCTIDGDMDALGSILAVMKVKGATIIGYEPIPDRKPRNGGQKLLPGPPPKKLNRKKGRAQIITDYLDGLAPGTKFGALEVNAMLKKRGFSLLNNWNPYIKAGRIKRVDYGQYERI